MKIKNNRNQLGFAHWLVLAALFVSIGALCFFAFRTVKNIQKQDSVAKSATSTKTDISNPPKFIQAEFIDLSKIYSISKYRSGEGHDFSSNGETCRSMKHYFNPQVDVTIKPEKAADGRTIPPQPDGIHDINIYSPVDGTITDITAERLPVGEQLYIKPSNAKDYTVRLFHIYKTSGIQKGTTLKAGQKIGVISGYSATDIAIEAGQGHYVSYFQVISDNIFEAYKLRGATSRDNFILSKEYRDSHALPCNQDKQGDQSFYYPEGYDHDADTFKLSGYVKPDYTKAQQGQHNLN